MSTLKALAQPPASCDPGRHVPSLDLSFFTLYNGMITRMLSSWVAIGISGGSPMTLQMAKGRR